MTKATRTVKKGGIPATQVFAEARKRPGYAEAYAALEDEFFHKETQTKLAAMSRASSPSPRSLRAK